MVLPLYHTLMSSNIIENWLPDMYNVPVSLSCPEETFTVALIPLSASSVDMAFCRIVAGDICAEADNAAKITSSENIVLFIFLKFELIESSRLAPGAACHLAMVPQSRQPPFGP